mgnify:CR=1 FL=1
MIFSRVNRNCLNRTNQAFNKIKAHEIMNNLKSIRSDFKTKKILNSNEFLTKYLFQW